MCQVDKVACIFEKYAGQRQPLLSAGVPTPQHNNSYTGVGLTNRRRERLHKRPRQRYAAKLGWCGVQGLPDELVRCTSQAFMSEG